MVTEVYYGVATARNDTAERAVRTRLLRHPRIDVDEEVAWRPGELLPVADDRVGDNAGVGPNGEHIAAMADVFGDAVLTGTSRTSEPRGVPTGRD